jgi:hypothetical protein
MNGLLGDRRLGFLVERPDRCDEPGDSIIPRTGRLGPRLGPGLGPRLTGRFRLVIRVLNVDG